MKSEETAPADGAGPGGDATRPGAATGTGPYGGLILEEAAGGRVPYGRLLRWGRRLIGWAPWLFSATLLLNVVQTLTGQLSVGLLPGVVQRIQDGPGIREGDPWFLPATPSAAVALLVGLMTGRLVLSFVTRVLNSYSDQALESELQLRLHEKLLSLGPEYHQDHPLGEKTQAVTRYSAATQQYLTDLYSTPVLSGISIVFGCYLLFENLTKFTTLPALVLTVMGALLVGLPLIAWTLLERLRDVFAAVRDHDLALSNELVNSLENPVEVQLLGAVDRRQQRFSGRVAEYFRVMIRASVYSELANQFQPIMTLLLQVVFLLAALAYGGEGAAIVAVVTQVPMIVAPLQQVIAFGASLQSMWPRTELVLDLLETEPAVVDREGARPLALERPPTLRLDDVTFAFQGSPRRILDRATCELQAGKVTAIVALSGMGKSTALGLLSRVRDPQGGTIRIDGRDLRDVTLASLRSNRNVAKAAQQGLFINDTVRENFLLGGPASDERIEAVCRATGFWSVLERLSPQRPLDVVVPRNLNEGAFSGGELRRFGVTRALLHDPKVLLLDEPTTGVSGTEKKQLLDCLRLAVRDKTVVLVEHDMSFVRALADRVLVLENGVFVEDGPPEELLERAAGRFRRFYGDSVAVGGAAAPRPDERATHDPS